MTEPKDIDFSDYGLSPEDQELLRQGYQESMKEYDRYLKGWSAAIEERLRQNEAKKAEKRQKPTRTKRRTSKATKAARKKTKTPRKKGKNHA